MFLRQKTILRFLKNEEGSVSKIRLTKLAFLLKNEVRDIPKTASYEFLPYHYGPFSFTLYHEINSLQRDGMVVSNDQSFHLCPIGEVAAKKLEKGVAFEVDRLSKRFGQVNTNALVSQVYSRYPWYTLNSKDEKKRSSSLPKASAKVYTVGYEGLMIDGLIDLLLKNGIQRLIDVRCNPIARRFGFHKSTMERVFRDLKIDYLHVPELGVPSDLRENLESDGDYAKLFSKYRKEIIPGASTALQKVITLIKEKPSVLMCKEENSLCCHRSHLGEIISQKIGLPLVELRDIYE